MVSQVLLVPMDRKETQVATAVPVFKELRVRLDLLVKEVHQEPLDLLDSRYILFSDYK
jgi:hypothetical protein